MRLKDRVALVIGGASGLGRASAEAFAEDGAKSMIADVNEATGKDVMSELRRRGGEAAFIKTDVTDEKAVKAAVDATLSEFGRLDILVTSVGAGTSDWHRSIDLYLKGTYYACKYALEAMERGGGGSIINVASISGVTGGVGRTVDETGYACGKHGTVGLTRTLALAYAKKNIRVNVVCPGYIKTPMNKMLHENPEEERRVISEQLRVPLDRWGEPHEIGKVVAFLASDDASYITGQPIIVDGGFMAR
jgi:NAD(P)-dependent dehydrogenase (short-subunit alcohol dehydrogenase family)